jgi:hypothetical protein
MDHPPYRRRGTPCGGGGVGGSGIVRWW